MDLAGRRPRWPIADVDQFRVALRQWIIENWDFRITVGEWWDRLASAGLTAPTWPRSQGGLAATTAIQAMIEEELATIGAIAPPVNGLGIRMVGAAIRQFATPAQFQEVLPDLLTGNHLWTALWHEPASNEPEATTCRAEFGWKYVTISGTKSTTDTAATHAMVLTRSLQGATGRDGLTWLLVEVGANHRNHALGTVEFRDAQMLHDRVLGTRDQGWDICKAILPFNERSLVGRIRRGLIHVEAGTTAGNLTKTVAETVALARARAQAKASQAGFVERRGT
ncbi:MAG: acyl-CoA dehydrogenase family protein [Actinobacteria bacterium]|nr:acyl-CoA dehydrogenase family protein [Actinomycetota bacterium]